MHRAYLVQFVLKVCLLNLSMKQIATAHPFKSEDHKDI